MDSTSVEVVSIGVVSRADWVVEVDMELGDTKVDFADIDRGLAENRADTWGSQLPET